MGLPAGATLATEGAGIALAAFAKVRVGRRTTIDRRALDRLLAECPSRSVAGVILPVQALKHPEYTSVECGVYAGAIVLRRKHPIEIHPSG